MSHDIVACPHCGGKAFTLLRGESGSIFGVTCRECNHSFNLDKGTESDVEADVRKVAEHIVETHTKIDERIEDLERRMDRAERDIDLVEGGI